MQSRNLAVQNWHLDWGLRCQGSVAVGMDGEHLRIRKLPSPRTAALIRVRGRAPHRSAQSSYLWRASPIRTHRSRYKETRCVQEKFRKFASLAEETSGRALATASSAAVPTRSPH